MSASAATADAGESMFAGLSDAEIEILRARAVKYARSVEVVAEHVVDVVVFARGTMRYGVPLGALREIRALRALCRIPGASACVPGVFHYRGEILSAHDLEAFLGGAGAPSGAASWVLVV